MVEKNPSGEWILFGTTHLNNGNVSRKLLQTYDNNYHNQGKILVIYLNCLNFVNIDLNQKTTTWHI